MKETVNKQGFLATVDCPLYGWLNQHGQVAVDDSPSAMLMRQQGMEINRLARGLFSAGRLVSDVGFAAAVEKTAGLVAGTKDVTLFEAAFRHGRFVARADVLERVKGKWHLREVKSSTGVSDDQFKDLAYTAAVLAGAGIVVSRASLVTMSPDYRLGMPVEKMFDETDATDDIVEFAGAYDALFKSTEALLFGPRPKKNLIFFCRKCEEFEECTGRGVANHIFDFPHLSAKKFAELTAHGITTIPRVMKGFAFTATQEVIYKSVLSGKPFVRKKLTSALNEITWPAYFLDFETISTAIPIYPDTAPYAQVVTQYSLHICSAPGVVESHQEYLADHMRDCRRAAAEHMLAALKKTGSVITYSHFEKDRINAMAKQFPDLAKDLDAVVKRIVDLCEIIKKNYYHPGFCGSFSIKQVLPTLIPSLDYGDLDIQEGGTAAALFTRMVNGEMTDKAEIQRTRTALLAYCQRDTLAMVKLHEKLSAL